MATTVSFSTHYKKQLKTKQIDESADSFKILLMRSGFTFSATVHAKKINVNTNTGAISLTWAASDKSVSRGSGSFVTDGFVPGMQCTSNSVGNPGPLTIATVTALKITFNEAITDETATKTLTGNDEIATGNGYTADTKTLGASSVSEDTANNRSDTTFPTVTWTASGGSIGPTAGAIIYDDTTSDKTIIGYVNFGADQTATNGTTFNIAALTFRGV